MEWFVQILLKSNQGLKRINLNLVKITGPIKVTNKSIWIILHLEYYYKNSYMELTFQIRLNLSKWLVRYKW